MNNKIIAGIVIAIIVLGGGYFLMRGKTTHNELASNSETVNSETQTSMQSGSLKSLLSAGSTRKCTYTTTQDGYSSTGTVYVDNGRMRGDFTTTVNGKATVSHMINKDSTMYIWTDGSPMAFKMAFDPNNAKPTNSSAQGSVDLEKNYDFDCASWSGDSSMFELPSGVNFSEMPTMSAGASAGVTTGTADNPSTGVDSKAAAQLACNYMSGTAKEECLKAIK